MIHILVICQNRRAFGEWITQHTHLKWKGSDHITDPYLGLDVRWTAPSGRDFVVGLTFDIVIEDAVVNMDNFRPFIRRAP